MQARNFLKEKSDNKSTTHFLNQQMKVKNNIKLLKYHLFFLPAFLKDNRETLL